MSGVVVVVVVVVGGSGVVLFKIKNLTTRAYYYGPLFDPPLLVILPPTTTNTWIIIIIAAPFDLKTRSMVHVFVAAPDGVRGKDVTCTFHRSTVELVACSRDSSIEPCSTETAITVAASNANHTKWKVSISEDNNC